MDEDMKARWVAALRSGEYKQGRHALKVNYSTPKYCCLGVLCEILPEVEEGPDGLSFFVGSERVGALGTVRNDLDPDGPNGIGHLRSSDREYLALLNDDGKSFAEIADYIEANL